MRKSKRKPPRHKDPRHGVAKHVATRRTEKLPVKPGRRAEKEAKPSAWESVFAQINKERD